MREKMRGHLVAGSAGQFDLKQGSGGIADIEFMVQYGVLAWSHDHPALLDWTDNIRLLEGFAAAGLMRREDAQLLSDAYRAFRAQVHRLTLQDLPAVVEEPLFSDYRQGVQRLWRELMEG
jgi:glutamate-ammonia-ligase adenylyltransferase